MSNDPAIARMTGMMPYARLEPSSDEDATVSESLISSFSPFVIP